MVTPDAHRDDNDEDVWRELKDAFVDWYRK